MPQPPNQPGDLERGNVRVDDHLAFQSRQEEPSQGESNSGDSSWPIFSMYSKTKEEEDNKIAEYLQKNGDGVLIFSGLFSASVAAFLTVTVQDLRPNSQDTSAFYLGNIYKVLADPNVTRSSIPYPVATPPPFSPPGYAVWVNSLWFLSFVLSLICALLALLLQLWARQYIRDSQPARCSPEKRARIRAFFAMDNLIRHHGIVEAFPILLGLSLFLFFAGLAVFLFNINHAVFGSVIWPIVNSTFIFGLSIVIRLRSLLQILTEYVPLLKTIEQKVLEWTRELDIGILYWSIRARDDDTLEKVFEAIPGFFNSKLVKHLKEKIPEDLHGTFWHALNGFLCRSFSYSLAESVKSHRLNIGMKAMGVLSSSPCDILVEGWGQVPPIAEMVVGQLLEYCTNDHGHTAHYAQCIAAKILADLPERDDRWIQFAADAFGLSERDLRDDDNDSMSLSIFIHLLRQSIHHRFYDLDALMAFSKLDIRHTRPGLQHDFCTLWNELVLQAKKQPDKLLRYPLPIPVRVLRRFRHLYIALHQGTAAAPTAFSASTNHHHRILRLPSSYPLCDIACHRPDLISRLYITNSRAVSISIQPGDMPGSSPYLPSHGGTTVSQQVDQANIIVGPPSHSNPTTSSKIGGTSHTPIATPLTNPVHPSPRPTNSGQTSSNIPKPVPLPASPCTPAPASETLIPSKTLTSCDASSASASDPMVPASSVVVFSDCAPQPMFGDPPLPDAEFLSLSGTTPPRPGRTAGGQLCVEEGAGLEIHAT